MAMKATRLVRISLGYLRWFNTHAWRLTVFSRRHFSGCCSINHVVSPAPDAAFYMCVIKCWNLFFLTLAACVRQPLGPSIPTPVAMNHLLLGKSALLSVRSRRCGPPSGAVPPPAHTALKSAHKPHRGSQKLHITAQGTVRCPSRLST